MPDILSIRSLLGARLGFDITDYYVMSYFKLKKELIRATKNGNLSVIQFISSLGFDIRAFYYYDKYFIYLTPSEYLFKISAECGHLNVVKCLVEQGANIHAQNEYALRAAAYKGHLDVVEYLVFKGANIHVWNNDALRCAAKNKHWNVVEYLESQGARII